MRLKSITIAGEVFKNAFSLENEKSAINSL